MKKNKTDLKKALNQFKDELCDSFTQGTAITTLTQQLVSFIDDTLIRLFNENHLHHHGFFCLLALGSYGRRELQLHSDVDLLLLHAADISEKDMQHAENLIRQCWDIGLDISHQITTPHACAKLAATDLTVLSSLLDARILCGRKGLFESLRYSIHPHNMWSSPVFFQEKIKEQKRRDEKYGDTAYHLEPNIKEGAGGLRDIHTLLAIGKRHFGIQKLSDGIPYGLISDKEYEELIACQHFLWKIRFGLHLLARKKEDRLLFDYQVKLAKHLGFEDNDEALAIEQLMKLYFKHIKHIREVNDMLLHWFSETILEQPQQTIQPLNAYFQLCNHVIEVTHGQVFSQHPIALLELFLWLAKHPEIQGVRAHTIRLIRQHLYVLTNEFKHSHEATRCFLSIFKEGINPYKALRHMNRYGVLGRYLDAFARVTGQMQYDLFHAYTVDQHTLFVIKHIVGFKHPSSAHALPLAHQLMSTLQKPHVLYLAALFHDIAKGRGGDHSELGANDAKIFAVHHRLDKDEQALLVWLVYNHLLMSHTAQRKDIYDAQTIQEFCQTLTHPYYLDYLYLLTVADIQATNPALWNSWKDALLRELYHASRLFFKEKMAGYGEKRRVFEKQRDALSMLEQEHFPASLVHALWSCFKDRYFLIEPPDVIARHTKAMLQAKKDEPLVLVMPHHTQASTEVLIFTPHLEKRFTITTTVLSNFRTTIQEAMISTTDHGYDLDLYIILDEKQQVVLDSSKQQAIQKALCQKLTPKASMPTLQKRRITQQQAHFKFKPMLKFTDDPAKKQTQLFLISTDRQGLLAGISRVLSQSHVLLHNAKIATAGERVEDMFFITNETGGMLDDAHKEVLKAALLAFLKH